MVELDSMQTAITQVPIQAAKAVVMALKEAATGPSTGTNLANMGEVHRPRHGRPALKQPAFHWKAPAKYTA